jgi:hypothetical protein
MRKDQPEIVVIGELACFFVAWVLCLGAALNEYRGRDKTGPANEIAATSNFSTVYDDLLE